MTVVDETLTRDLTRTQRGARHVRIGLALAVLGTLALVTLTALGDGPGRGLGLTGWVGAVAFQFALIAAVFASNRPARGFAIFSGLSGAFGSVALLAASFRTQDGVARPDWLMVTFALCVGVIAFGTLLATVTPAARAWHHMRLAARRAQAGRAPERVG
jgi:hypothetical protein